MTLLKISACLKTADIPEYRNGLFGVPLGQTKRFVEKLLHLVGLNWSVPDFSALCRW